MQREIERLMKETPRMALGELLPRKLEAVGVEPKPELVEALTNHFLKSGGGKFSWDDGKDDETLNVRLKFDGDDIAEVQGISTDWRPSFPRFWRSHRAKRPN
jgi:hypothetical protein